MRKEEKLIEDCYMSVPVIHAASSVEIFLGFHNAFIFHFCVEDVTTFEIGER